MSLRYLGVVLTVLLLITAVADFGVPGLCRIEGSPGCGGMTACQQTLNRQNSSPTQVNETASSRDDDPFKFNEDCFCCGQIIAVSFFEKQINEMDSPSLSILIHPFDIPTVPSIHHPPRSV